MNVVVFSAQSGWSRGDPGSASAFMIVVGILLAILILFNMVKSFRGKGGNALSGAPVASRTSFLRSARRRGIPDADVSFLNDIARAIGTVNPEFVFQNTQKLDSFFRDAFKYIEKHSESETVADEEKARLFSIREGITQRAIQGSPISSTRELDRNTTLSIVSPDESIRPSVVRIVEPGGLGVERPLDEFGEGVRIPRGTRLTVFFYRKAHQGYTFTTRAAGYQDAGGSNLLVLKHSDAVSALPARSNLRREIDAPCRFSQVHQVPAKERGKTGKGLVVDKLEIHGTIVDISAGGCAIKTATLFGSGTLVKITFEAADGIQAAIGSVVRISSMQSGGIMHIRFARISKKAVNAVLSWVYGYTD
ncbi:MAG: PilZ domain-containing protein [Spirochaetes bacterium]|nr:PilZ domain-containing protein [Spirochaetota bacterium]